MTGNASTLEKQLDISLAAIAPLLKDPAITDIYIDGAHRIYVKYLDGRVESRPEPAFESPLHLENLAELLARAQGVELGDERPFLDTMLEQQRINVVTRPAYPPGTCLTIRKKPQNRFRAGDLLRTGTLTPGSLSLLKQAVKKGSRILVAGETGSGKTTLLDVLCGFIEAHRGRVITIEDTRELFFDHPFRVPLLAVVDPAKERDACFKTLLINALRMDPAWIVLGEVRGSEAATMLDAFICHPGMATIHARGCRQAVTRLKSLLCTGSRIPSELAEESIFEAVDLVVFIEKTPEGPRRVSRIVELRAVSPANKINPIFDISTKGRNEHP